MGGWVRRRTFLLLGALAVVPLVLVDPALLVFLFDLEFLTLLGTVGVLQTRDSVLQAARSCWARIAVSAFVLEMVAGWRLTRAEPRSLLT